MTPFLLAALGGLYSSLAGVLNIALEVLREPMFALLLGAFAFGDVNADAGNPVDFPMLVPHREGAAVDPANLSVGADNAIFELRTANLQAGIDRVLGACPVVGMD